MVFSNLDWTTGGTAVGFSFGFSADGRSFESDAILLYEANGTTPKTQSAVAAEIRTNLFNVLRQLDSSLNDIGAITVTPVSGLAANQYAFDIAFSGQLAGRDIAQIIINPVALKAANRGSGDPYYYNLSFAGFSPGGQDSQQASATTFSTLNDLMARFQQSVNDNLDGATFSVNPRFDVATSSFLFDLKFHPAAQVQATPLAVQGSVGDLSHLAVDATLDLSSQALFEGTVGFDFRTLNTFAMAATGSYKATLTADSKYDDALARLALPSAFAGVTGRLEFNLGTDSYTVTVAGNTTYTLDSLIDTIQAKLDNTAVTGGGDLASRGFSWVGDAVKTTRNTSGSDNYLRFTVGAAVDLVTIKDTSYLTAVPASLAPILGFTTPAVGVPQPTAALPANGILDSGPAPKVEVVTPAIVFPVAIPAVYGARGSSPAALDPNAHFSLIIDGTAPVAVTVTKASTADNSSIADLIIDINAALDATSVAGNGYLSSVLGFSNLGQIVHAYPVAGVAGKLQLITLTDKVGSLEVFVASEADTAVTNLGFESGQKARTSGAAVFLQNVTLGGDWSATVHDQTASVDTTLAESGSVEIGMLDLTFNQLDTNYQGSYRFELRKDATQNTTTNDDQRLSLHYDLFPAVTAQTGQLGMTGVLATNSSQAVEREAVQSNGRLLRDLGLSVTIAGAGAAGVGTAPAADLVLDVTVTKASTATNNSFADLADDVDKAIADAVTAAGVTTVPGTASSGTAVTTAVTAGTSGTEYKAKYGYVGLYQFFENATTTHLLQFFAPDVTQPGSSAAPGEITVEERLLVGNTITNVEFAQNSGAAGAGETAPTASLEFGSLGIVTSASLASVATVTPGTLVTVAVDNMVAMLEGGAPSTTVTVVPPTGLGVLTPLTQISWSDVSAQFAYLPELFGSLAGLGQYGELGRLLPILGIDASSLFGLNDRLDAIQAALAELDGSVLGVISAAASVTQLAAVDVSADATFALSFDNETAYDFTLAASVGATRGGLVDDLQGLLDTQSVEADSALAKLGYSKVGQAVKVQIDRTSGQLKFVVRAGVQTIALTADAASTFVTELGFLPSVSVVPAPATVSAASLQTVLGGAFGTTDVTLSYDSAATALRFKIPYTVNLDQSASLNILFSDEFTKLLSADQQALLADLAGTVSAIADGEGLAPLALTGTLVFNLDFGLDLDTSPGNASRFGKLFLYDHFDVGSDSSLTNDSGTFATVTLDASATGMEFDQNAGIFALRVQGGEANLSADATLKLDSAQDGAGLTVGRVYLNDYDVLDAAAAAPGATRGDLEALADFRQNSFDVMFTGTAMAELPLLLVASDDLGQLALENLSGFVNPMPIGTMEVHFTDIGQALQTVTDQTLHVDVATQSAAGNTLTLSYNGSNSTVTVAASNATSGIVSTSEIKTALSNAVAALLKPGATADELITWASMVEVSGSRTTGFNIALTGKLATDYLSAGLVLAISAVESANGAPRGTYATPVISDSVKGIVVSTQGTVVSFAYAGSATTPQTVTIAAVGASGTDTDAEIYAAFKSAVSTLLFGNATKAGEVTVSGTRKGYTVTLTGSLASFTGQLTVSTTEVSGDSSFVRAVTMRGVPLSDLIYKSQTIQFAVGAGTPVSVNLAQSDVLTGLAGDSDVRAVMADAVLSLIAGPVTTFTSDIPVVVVADGGETLTFSYGVARQTLTLGAIAGTNTATDISSIKAKISTLLTGGTGSVASVTVTGTRSAGYAITLTGALATSYAGELRVKSLAGVEVRHALVSVSGDRAAGFDIVLSTGVATELGAGVLSATVKDMAQAATPTDTASGSVTVSGLNVSANAQTLFFSYPGKAAVRLGIAPTNSGYGLDTDAEIISAIQATVSSLLTGSTASGSGITPQVVVTGTRATSFTITLNGALASGYTGTLTVKAYDNALGATQGTYTRGNPLTLATQVAEAAQPAVAGSPAPGTADAGAEGAPDDVDNEAALNAVDSDPYIAPTGGEGVSSSPSSSGVLAAATSSSAPTVQPSATGQAISYILPDISHWQDTMAGVLQEAGGTKANPDQLASFPLIFLLRDPTILVNSLDSVFAGLQTGLETLISGIGKLPLVGDQLVSLTQAGGALDFITSLRRDVLGSIKTALESAIQTYGGLDNALRMVLFDVLTNDSNNDWVIDDTDFNLSGYNPFLNFVRDYNGDGAISPDDIVVEYLIGEDQDFGNLVLPETMDIPTFSAGQRTFWVTSGMNAPLAGMTAPATSGTGTGTGTTATLSIQAVNYGGYRLGFTMGDGQVISTALIASDATADDIQAALLTALNVAVDAEVAISTTGATLADFAGTVVVVDGTDEGTFDITLSGGPLPGTFSVTYADFTTDAGKLVLDAGMEAYIQAYYDSNDNPNNPGYRGDPIGSIAGDVSTGATLTLLSNESSGEFTLGFSYTNPDGVQRNFESVGIPRNASALQIQQAAQSLWDDGRAQYAEDFGVAIGTLADTVTVTGASGTFTITVSGGTLPVDFNFEFGVVKTDYTGFDRQSFMESVLDATTGIEFRMALGQSFNLSYLFEHYGLGQPLDFDFDVGVDGLPLYLAASGGLDANFGWQFLLGFGVDVTQGFFLNANMAGNAGIGSKTVLGAGGIAIGTEENADDDAFSNLYAVGRSDFDLARLGMFDALFEHPDEINWYEGLGSEELSVEIDIFLKGADRNGDGVEDAPFSVEGQLFFLNAQLHDDWSGYVKDNTGAYWGDVSRSAEATWIKAERVLVSSGAYSGASVRSVDASDATYGFILPDDSHNGFDDSQYDLDYRDLDATYASDHGGTHLFSIDGSGYLRYAVAYTIGNGGGAVSYTAGAHVQMRGPDGLPLPVNTTPLNAGMFNGATGKEGSRTHLYFQANIDFLDPSEEPGFLTFPKLAGHGLSDFFKGTAVVRAQINMVAEFGIGLNGAGFLPSIHGGFHLLFAKEKVFLGEDEDPSPLDKVLEFINPSYDKLFGEDRPTIWLTDIGLDMGTFVSNFLTPVARKVQEVVAPIQPVIDLLTTSIPGLDQIFGRPYSLLDLAWDMNQLFGGDARIKFVISVARLLVTITHLPTDSKNLIIPVVPVLALVGDPKLQINLGPVKGALANVDIAGLSSGFSGFSSEMKKPGNALSFPILDNPFQTVLNLLTGKPADLILFNPPGLEINVEFEMSFPVVPLIGLGIGGSLRAGANLTIGYDTYGITQALKSNNWLDVFEGFYVSDNIVNGVDVPEVFLETRIYAFAELNLFIVKGGVQGGIKFIGTLDLCDPNKDGKVRTGEIIAAIQDNPLDLVSAKLTASAYISAYVKVFALFGYKTIYEHTFMDVTLFSFEHNPCDKNPVLAIMDGSTLIFNTGSTVASIDGYDAINQQASDRLRRDTTDGNEIYTLSTTNGLTISATLPNGQTYQQSFAGVTAVRGYAGEGNDTFDASVLSIPVFFVAGSGTDVLIGGSGNDVLIGSSNGTATLRGNGGSDTLIARGGTTVMAGAAGNDTYRFLGNWGQSTLIDGAATDTDGENTLDFGAQTSAVTLDDGLSRVLRGNNAVVWNASTLIDQLTGGSGSDILDFSGREANLTMSVTGANAGWVTNAATGDGTVSDFSKSAVQTGIGTRGFRFTAFENVVGGQGSDVFYMRDGAHLSGSMYGDTTTGLHHDDSPPTGTGNENANARNTIDFSDYTTTVSVNEEGSSAFGSGGLQNLVVRGMHNIFGGAGNDTLIGDGRNNLIVGNGGADVLEGRAAHDLLVADEFKTRANESAAAVVPVRNYVSLETVGISGGFGADGRRWIWLGQTLENTSLTTSGQTLKGGSGNDILLGALGADVFNIGGAGEGNDTIMADLGRVKVDYFYRSALEATTLGSAGGNDRIYLGSGDNLVLAGTGNDTVEGLDTATSMNIIIADTGEVRFRYSLQDVDPSATTINKYTFDTRAVSGSVPASNHMLEYVRTTTPPIAQGGNDTISLASGSGIVLGGAGTDTIVFSAVSSNASNVRWVAGDHATLNADTSGSVISFATDDTASTTGGADAIAIGQANDSNLRYLGDNYVLGGMGADTILVSADYDGTTVTHGAANSRDVILGDNGSITRPAGSPYLASVASTQISATVGGNDLIATANGDKLIIGGQGGDTILVDAASVSNRYIVGDNGTLTFDTAGGMTDLVTTDTVTPLVGWVDTITVGHATATLNTTDIGLNVIAGGMGADVITVLGVGATGTSVDTILGDNGEVHRNNSVTGTAYALRSVLSTQLALGGSDTITTANGDKVIVGGWGMDGLTVDAVTASNRFIVGDNGEITFDTTGGMTDLVTTDTVATTGDVDTILIGHATAASNTTDIGLNVIAGGMGADVITVLGVGATGTSVDTILGDNSEVHRNDSVTGTAHALRSVLSTQLALGGNDTITTANGNKVIVGGWGMDGLTVDAVTASNRFIVGDNGEITFDTTGGMTDLVTTDTVATTGDVDTILIGHATAASNTTDIGLNVIAGGMGADVITVLGEGAAVTATSFDTILGDNGEVHRNDSTGMLGGETVVGTAYALRSVFSTLPGLGGNDTITTANGNKVIVGGFGDDTIIVDASSFSKRWIVGDNGSITLDTKGGMTDLVTTDTVASTGGNDTIRIGHAAGATNTTDLGENVIAGGMGGDNITVLGVGASGTSFDTILGDNGQIRRNDWTGKRPGETVAGNPYALREVLSTLLGLGGVDTIVTGNGDKVIVGGIGGDTVTISATSNSTRMVLGDNGQILFDRLGGMTDMLTTDVADATGGDDIISIGIAGSLVALGNNFVFGGMGNDRIFVTGRIDPVSGKRIAGTATSEDILFGDNGEIHRLPLTNKLTKLVSTVTDKGGDDIILTGNGGKVVIGGYGSDEIVGVDGTMIVLGDNAQVDYDVAAQNGVLRQVQNTATVIGGNDTITLAEGFKLVLGGYGKDTIAIAATSAASTSGTRVVTGLFNATGKAALGRYVVGDNALVTFDITGGLFDIRSTDAISSTGDDDSITLGALDTTAELGYQVVIGGMGADTITVRPDATSEDVIFGDNGEYQRKALDYSTIAYTSLATDKGGDDLINSGRGIKTVIGGFGSDRINLRTVMGAGPETTPSNRSLVLGDSGTVSFDPSGSGRLLSVQSVSLSFGGADTVNIGDGDVTFIGGYGIDTMAVDSTQSAFRVAAGDNARFNYSISSSDLTNPADLTELISLDSNATTGASDNLRFGAVGGISGSMGIALLMGGMDSDTLTVTGANATHVTIAGDNADILRVAGRNGVVTSFQSLLPDQGAGDTIQTIDGTYLLVGGQGSDTIRAGAGFGTVFGDSGTATFTSAGLSQFAASISTAQGGNDTIDLGSGGAAADGNKVVIGGFGADSITIISTRGDGTRDRVLAGDNATINFDASGRFTSLTTNDPNASTGGNDTITVSIAGDPPADNSITDNNVIAGGPGGDILQVFAAARTHDVIAGDNLDYRRAAGTAIVPYADLFAEVLQPITGGNDTIRSGSGFKLILGGTGNDTINVQTVNGATLATPFLDTGIVFGDAGAVTFASSGSGNLTQIVSSGPSIGGNDIISIGAGRDFVMGGFGNDTVTVNSGDNNVRAIFGDEGQIDFDALTGAMTVAQTTGNPSADPSSTRDSLTLPGTGTNLVFGGPGFDALADSAYAGNVRIPETGSIHAPESAGRVVSIVTLGENGDLGVFFPEPGVLDPNGTGGSTDTSASVGTGTVSEDGTLTATGRLQYPALAGGFASFTPQTAVAGNYGTFSLSADGTWSYTLLNAQASVQALRAGDARAETFFANTVDGSVTTVTITVNGSDDAAVITGTDTGAATQDNSQQVLVVTGVLAVADPDVGQAGFAAAVQASAGALGTLQISTAGAWTYSVPNAAVRFLGQGQTRTENFTVTSTDGNTSRVISVTLTGINDTPEGGLDITGAPTQGQTLSVSNTLSDAEGMGAVSYQWQESSDGTSWNAIGGATTSSLLLSQAQVGKQVRAVASYTDGFGTAESAASSATTAVANVNDASTGVLAVTGTAAQGRTLTVANSLADADGLGAVSLQWEQSTDGTTWSTLAGESGANLLLAQAHVGKQLRVVASYTDGFGTAESVISNATLAVANVNDAPTGSVTVTGTATQGQTLSVANALADADGLGAISVQWEQSTDGTIWNAISGQTGANLALTQAQVGKQVRAVASYTDGQGLLESVASNATVAVANVNDAPTGAVTVTGTATQGQTLTVANTLADVDGLGTIGVQWEQSADGTTWSAISGQTGANLVLTQAQVGKQIRTVASYTDGQGTPESVVSNATAAVTNVNDAPTGAVTVTGTATQGQTLSVANTLADADGLGTISVQWEQSTDGTIWNAISGQTGANLALTQAQVGKQVRAVASYTDGFGAAESVASNATVAVANVNDAPTGAVTVTGTATQGQTLTVANTLADVDGLGTIGVQWEQSADGTTWSAISGQTGANLVLTQAQVGKQIRTVASYTDSQGTPESVVSNATAAVTNVNDAPTGAVTVTGTPTQGQTLTVANTLADADGLGTIGVQWEQSADGTTWSAIAGETGASLVLTQAQVGKQVRSVASYTDGFGAAESVVSNATTAVLHLNTPAAIEGVSSGTLVAGTVTEDAGVDANGNLTLNGQLSVTDVDPGEAAFGGTVTASNGAFGQLTITAGGNWRYSVSNAAIQSLKSSDRVTEEFTVRSVDGTASMAIRVVVQGVDEAAVDLSGVASLGTRGGTGTGSGETAGGGTTGGPGNVFVPGLLGGGTSSGQGASGDNPGPNGGGTSFGALLGNGTGESPLGSGDSPEQNMPPPGFFAENRRGGTDGGPGAGSLFRGGPGSSPEVGAGPTGFSTPIFNPAFGPGSDTGDGSGGRAGAPGTGNGGGGTGDGGATGSPAPNGEGNGNNGASESGGSGGGQPPQNGPRSNALPQTQIPAASVDEVRDTDGMLSAVPAVAALAAAIGTGRARIVWDQREAGNGTPARGATAQRAAQRARRSAGEASVDSARRIGGRRG